MDFITTGFYRWGPGTLATTSEDNESMIVEYCYKDLRIDYDPAETSPEKESPKEFNKKHFIRK